MPRPASSLALTGLLAVLGAPGALDAREDLSGTWREDYEEIVVAVEQWSAPCGEPPRTPGRRERDLRFEIQDRGVELVFFGPRGERFSSVDCQSPDPRMRTRELNLQDALFLVTCSTPEDPTEYENGLYSFRVQAPDRIEYRETSRYARNQESAQCVHTRRVRRAYSRLARAAPTPPPEAPPSDAGTRPEDEDQGKTVEGEGGGRAGTADGAGQEKVSEAGARDVSQEKTGEGRSQGKTRAGTGQGQEKRSQGKDKADTVEGTDPGGSQAVTTAGRDPDVPPPERDPTDGPEPAEPAALPASPPGLPSRRNPPPAVPPPPPSPPGIPLGRWVGLGGGLACLLVVAVLLLTRKPRWRPPAPTPPKPPPPPPSPAVFCTGCGARLPGVARFCPYCSQKVG
jgi:hypothetical protein